MDLNVRKLITDTLGGEAQSVLQVVDEQLKLEDSPIVPPLSQGKTYGDWSIFIPYTGEELRPVQSLTYESINYMLSTGIVRFALDIKRAQTSSVMNNEKSIKMVTPDKELADIAMRGYMRIAPQFIYELTHSSLAYGTAFFETPWLTMSGYELGVSDKKTSKFVSVPDMPNLVPHRTVRAIRRKPDGTYNGFIQNIYPYFTHPLDAKARDILLGQNDIIVEADASLVVPYNGISRNLWGESFLTPIYTLWFWYELIMRCLVRYSELMGDPIRLAKAPLKKKLVFSDTGKTVEAMDYMLNLAVGLSKSNAVVIPSDLDVETRMPLYDMTYLVTPDRSQPFVQILDMLSQYILQSAVAGTRQVVGEKYNPDIGSNTVGNIALHNEMIVNSWVFYINKYFINKFSTYNRGKGGPPVWMEVQGLDPKEREFMSTMMSVAGNSSTFQEFFYQVDWQRLGESAGLPMLSPEQTEALKAKLAEQQPPQEQINEAALELAKDPPLALTQQELSSLKPIELEKPFSISMPDTISESIRDGFKEIAAKLETSQDTIQLAGNPFHDKLGRFASKAEKAVGKAASETKKFAKGHKTELLTVAAIAVGAAATAGGVKVKAKHNAQQKIEKALRIVDAKKYQEIYNASTPTWKKILCAPAEYAARKEGLGPQLARLAMEVGPDIAFGMTIGSALYSNSAIMGAAATAAISTALFGAAPGSVVVLGGLTVGIGASMIASEIVDHIGEKVVHTYINRASPKDPHHLTMQKSLAKKSVKAANWVSTIQSGVMAIGFEGIMALTGMGGAQNSALISAMQQFALENEEEPIDNYDIAVAILPMVSAMKVGALDKITLPYEFPGFKLIDNQWTMTPDTIDEFIESGDIKLENILSLGFRNYVRDASGRFSKSAGLKVAKTAIKTIGKDAITGAVGGAVTGAVAGTFKSAFNMGEYRSNARLLSRVKRGFIRGAISGGKKGAIKALINSSFAVGAKHAGKYGWAVKSAGGVGVAMVGKKHKMAMSDKDISNISHQLVNGGFSDLAKQLTTLELEGQEINKEAIAEFAYMLGDFLENSNEEYLGLDENPALEELGFVTQNGFTYMHRDDVESLLASLLAWNETPPPEEPVENTPPQDGGNGGEKQPEEVVSPDQETTLPEEKKINLAELEETITLGNPYHDEEGKFTSKSGNKTGVIGFVKEHKKELALGAAVVAVAAAVGINNLKKSSSTTKSPGGTPFTSESVNGTKKSNAGQPPETPKVNRPVTSKIIYPEGHTKLGEATRDSLNTASVMGAGVVDELGVKGPADINWHVSRFTFAREMAKDLGQDLSGLPNTHPKVRNWVEASKISAYAFSAKDGNVHFGPDAVSNAHKPMEHIGATVAHEVFHSRDALGTTSPIRNSKPLMKTEEMMASTVGSIAYSRIKNGGKGQFTKKDLTKDFWKSAKDLGVGEGVGYSAGYRKTLFRAAAYKMRATNAIAKKAGLPIPYSHPADVVNNWFKDATAHSDIHNWIIKSGGVETPTGSYSFPGFKFLGSIQLEDSIKLIGNPFHDTLGRFTSSSLSVGLVNSYKDKLPAKLDPKMKVVVAKDWGQVKQLLGTTNQGILGAYHNHTLVLSPNATKQNAERIVRHEAYHGRVRANGLTGVNTMNKHTVDLEEGTTELLTFRGFNGGDPTKSWYYPQMKNVASVARKVSGGDINKAWKYVDNLHYYNGSSQSIAAVAHHTGQKDVSKYLRGNNSGDDLKWLLSHPVKLEDFDEAFAKSEQAIYNEIRKIEDKPFDEKDIPEELLNGDKI